MSANTPLRSAPGLPLKISNVSKSFATNRDVRPVLTDISITVNRGEFVSLIGPSGCGKSTLFNILAGLDRADSGEVVIDGVTLPLTGSAKRFRHRAAHCAYMPQDDVLFPWRTVLDNAILGLQIAGTGRAEARARARDLFPAFGLTGFEDAHPEHLSGGMRQRVALLRTVLQGTNTLLLDEPFGALDSLTRTDMQDWLHGMWRDMGWTILLITHDIREAVRLSDRVIALTPRPASVRGIIELSRPRGDGFEPSITSQEMMRAETTLTTLLHNT
ncbi:ABC transporter ATP-binding protein [Klugiella xanthotipulae]|uniref:ABC-type nitrate/sulfonate/bicarbonate transport system ATPase subunit n=1 Tax=Klugiella xanthotipulae TaxID=244735 RepID=A0A543HSZ5_9MICO|nr:ABC transporter ATP-binding protein [Klugiella xanthotipulae]TQM61463.1 ABC-type nitrate/sulfonate/bicarbonate transport system ATPase subunit [Klugiella xanthotipulae]